MDTNLIGLLAVFLLLGLVRLWIGGLARLWLTAPTIVRHPVHSAAKRLAPRH
jgi:hypothetical protein